MDDNEEDAASEYVDIGSLRAHIQVDSENGTGARPCEEGVAKGLVNTNFSRLERELVERDRSKNWDDVEEDGGRGLHSSTSQLNLSGF